MVSLIFIAIIPAALIALAFGGGIVAFFVSMICCMAVLGTIGLYAGWFE